LIFSNIFHRNRPQALVIVPLFNGKNLGGQIAIEIFVYILSLVISNALIPPSPPLLRGVGGISFLLATNARRKLVLSEAEG
jgi:hypothetical protein